MKQSFKILAVALAFVAAASCSKEIEKPVDNQPSAELVPTTISASIDATKATVASDGKTLWQENDAIAVWIGGQKYEMTLIEGAGTKSAVFKGNLPEEGVISAAVSPASAAGKTAGIPVPVFEQTIAAGATCDPAALIMSAGAPVEGRLAFQNACGGARFTVGAGIKSILVYCNEGQVSVALPATAGSFDVFLPAAEYSNILIVATTVNDDVYGVKLPKNLNIKRSVITNLGTLAGEPCTVINNATKLQAYLADPQTDAFIVKDIDLAEVTLTSCESFGKTLDGMGHSLKNADLSNGIFKNVTAEGAVKNIVTDASCSAKADAAVFGTIVTVNAGLVSGCVNNAKISTTAAHAAGAIGGVVGQSTGFVEKCANNGDITVETTSITGAIYYGGVVGQIAKNKTESNDILVDHCENSGSIKIHCSTTPKNAYVGGVVGGNTATKLADIKLIGSVENCTNTGNVEYGFDVLSSGTYTDLGGVIGYLDGHLKDCKNTGNVAYTLPVSDLNVNATCPAVGGVAGVVIGNAESLINKGNLSINGVWAAGTGGNAGAGGYHQPIYGGVIAKHGTGYDAANDKVKADKLDNYGTISGNMYMKNGGGTVHMLGGVLGCSNGILSNLNNHGTINVLMGGKSNYVGGIIGHHSGSKISDCTNEGDVTVDGSNQVITSQIIAGIVGYELIKGGELTNLENKGAVTLNESNPATSTSYQYVAGVMGSYSGNSQKLSKCINSGAITSNTTKKLRAAGIVASIYDSSTKAPTFTENEISDSGVIGTNPMVDCHNYGDIIINNAGNPQSANVGSVIGGVASYCSIGLVNCSNEGDIILSDCAGDTAAGLMSGVINRRYSMLDCNVGGTIVSNVAGNKLGLVAGTLYTDPTLFDLGSAEKPLTIAASATINGAVPSLTASGLVGGNSNACPLEKQLNIVNVVRE